MAGPGGGETTAMIRTRSPGSGSSSALRRRSLMRPGVAAGSILGIDRSVRTTRPPFSSLSMATTRPVTGTGPTSRTSMGAATREVRT